jgi:hypothetical protein
VEVDAPIMEFFFQMTSLVKKQRMKSTKVGTKDLTGFFHKGCVLKQK